MNKGDRMDIVVDGERFNGLVTQLSRTGGVCVKVEFYFSESAKHGKVTRNPAKSFWVGPDLKTIIG